MPKENNYPVIIEISFVLCTDHLNIHFLASLIELYLTFDFVEVTNSKGCPKKLVVFDQFLWLCSSRYILFEMGHTKVQSK